MKTSFTNTRRSAKLEEAMEHALSIVVASHCRAVLAIATHVKGRRLTCRSRIGLLVTALLIFAPGVARAQRPDIGGRNIQDFAYADFFQQIGCLDASSSVVFVAGSNLQGPIGSGKPGAWQDVQVFLTLHNWCTQSELVLYGINTADVIPTFMRLEAAVVNDLDVTLCDVPTCDGQFSVRAVVDLTWTGNDDATVRILHNLDVYRQERFETASVSGTLVIDSIPAWTNGIEFTAENVTGGVIGTANEINVPFKPGSLR